MTSCVNGTPGDSAPTPGARPGRRDSAAHESHHGCHGHGHTLLPKVDGGRKMPLPVGVRTEGPQGGSERVV